MLLGSIYTPDKHFKIGFHVKFPIFNKRVPAGQFARKKQVKTS